MNDLSVPISVDIALHIGLLAITFTLLILRIPDLRKSIERLYDPINRTKILSRIILTEILFRVLSLGISLYIFHISFKYFDSLEDIVGPFSKKLDFALFKRNWEEAEKFTEQAIRVNSVSILIFVIEYLISLYVTWKNCSAVLKKSVEFDKLSSSYAKRFEDNNIEVSVFTNESPVENMREMKLCGKQTSLGKPCKKSINVSEKACNYHK
ncbi:MAG: hypothetical protein JKY22_11630 [Flavobacteriaceae bacterium]|nr:hypothetical protein [Flavobacteriaceae bacterium]